ncbi:MAG: serine/threonine-protein kinase [Verrucomicrobiota bacterium]
MEEPTEPDPSAETEVMPDDAKAMAAAAGSNPTNPLGTWEPPSAKELDALLEGYDVETLIGRVGMGAVYKGVQKNLDRIVAIKILPEELAGDPDFEERFEREAKALAQLNHQNIVQIYDFGQSAGRHWFFAMEFVDGVDFHDLIKTGQLESEGALNAVSQMCDALAYAHGEGLIHRDIKPANIFLNKQGILKIGDFGLAKIIDPAAADSRIASLTMTGAAMGTPHYSAPEQMDGREVDHRADIYSLGVMFYEMLTGKIPQGAFDPPSKKVEVDVRVDEVVLRAMAEEPERRYQTVVEVRTDVDAIREKPASENHTTERAPCLPALKSSPSTASLRPVLWVMGSCLPGKLQTCF